MNKKRIIMPQFFPSEIIKNSSENYFSENETSGRIIYISVILLFIVGMSLLPFMSVQVTTQSEGVVRSGYEENPIVPVVTGQVISCRISENQSVNKGDTLLTIKNDRIIQDSKFMKSRLSEDQLLYSDLQGLIQGKVSGFKTELYKQDYQTFADKLAEQKTQIIQAEREYLMIEILYKKGITPKHDYETVNNQFQYEKNKYQTLQAQQLTLWQERLKETAMFMADRISKIEQLNKEKEMYCLIAPIAGTISGFIGIQAGNFVVPNQPIARIAPDNNLLVECYVPTSDIGLIDNGMPVSFQFHAYNYNLWGIATGIVNEISGNVINLNNRPFFRVRCQMDQSFLKLKNGTKGNLKKGMTLTGRFKVAERTLFQLLYDKADNWINPKLKST
jgi:multidrug resistance efflux pump